MSGGVDSTAAAFLLKENGYCVRGITMEVAPRDAKSCGNSCYGPENIAEIKKIAAALGIEHASLDLREEYAGAVLEYFKEEYLKGRTPNPCVMCNRKVKFGALLEKAEASGLAFDKFATGHYARLETGPNGEVLLRSGADRLKDQTYFLWNIPRAQLTRVLFPLGGLSKKEVRGLMLEAGFTELARKAESQDFAPPEAVAELLKPHSLPGNIVDAAGKILGRHDGIGGYTIGQRKGLGIGGVGEPLFVTSISAEYNTVSVGSREKLMQKTMRVKALNWISINAPQGRLAVSVKIRRQHDPARAELQLESEDVCVVEFKDAQFAPTPGQSAVFYDGELLLGGGIIDSAG